MSEDNRITISSGTSANPDDIARRSFPTVRKGYDPKAVRALLESVADELRAGARREAGLHEALADAERRAKNPELDEAGYTAALGAETARVLQTAHEAAHEIVARAEAIASKTIDGAEHSAALRTEQSELAAATIQDDATAEAKALVANATDNAEDRAAKARVDADGLVEATKEQCRGMVRDARQVRERILRDLNERRRVLRLQVEQLLAGRTTVMGAVDTGRGALGSLPDPISGQGEDPARPERAPAGPAPASRATPRRPHDVDGSGRHRAGDSRQPDGPARARRGRSGGRGGGGGAPPRPA